ncbi:major facilitator superfamily MFS_1 [Rhizobium sp. CF080]|uniref:MFS transporter n=1 Tax=Rhizobium sp. (strain CF080) TaxID=1144310 RepID=UPI000271D715|nr:MFS transporter [Rhizobium sp. CF080]EUB97840.1 major facilitator superfamily MFS_1 [Rhizobium sp. CF080]
MSTATIPETPAAGRWSMLALLCLAVVLSFSCWFSANSIAPELKRAWSLSESAAAWLTNGVQIGFVIGALTASLFNLPDLIRMNRLMAASALLAALSNAALALEPGPTGAILCRMVTGFALAGVYPPALKLVSTWFISGRGLALAGVIGAITAGSSLPHLFRGMSSAVDWHNVVLLSSGATLVGAVVLLAFTREGPYPFGKALFDPRQIGRVLKDRNLLLVNGGYLGHMWELYAMWAWLLAYLTAALDKGGTGISSEASLLTFIAVASGVLGCFAGGVLSDRFGRTATTAGLMIVSGACALTIGFVFDGPFWLLALVVIVWGISIIGDSAQFSAAVTELADRNYIGTALSLQMGMGFALTIFMIWLMPHLAELLGGWRWAFVLLAIGPIFGAASMLILRRRPEAVRLAGGRR